VINDPLVKDYASVRADYVSVIVDPVFAFGGKCCVFTCSSFCSILTDQDELLVENVIFNIIKNAGRPIVWELSGSTILLGDRLSFAVENIAQFA
jgi:hypothetical protein